MECAERRTGGAGQSPEFRTAKRANCPRRRSPQLRYGGQARTCYIRIVAGLPSALNLRVRWWHRFAEYFELRKKVFHFLRHF